MKKGSFTIDELILNESFQKYILKGTKEDTNYWESWIKENPEANDVFIEAKETISFIAAKKNLPKHPLIREQVFNKLQTQIENEIRRRGHPKVSPKKYIRYYWYAASVLLLLSFYFMVKNIGTNDINIAGNYLEVIVPDGQRSQLLLPDGTKVWLNSGSKFKYPTVFSNRNREVYITGEAFFNVSHNKKYPFIVHTNDRLSVKVLGTEFNIKCYPSEKVIETTLVKGKIRLLRENENNKIIQELNLVPNEKAIYQKNNKIITISELTKASETLVVEKRIKEKQVEAYYTNYLEPITAWKDDALVFQDETFSEIAVKMERWFGIKITISNEGLKKEKFTGKFTNNETIYQILDIFNRSEPIQYTTNKKEITIMKRKKNIIP